MYVEMGLAGSRPFWVQWGFREFMNDNNKDDLVNKLDKIGIS